LGFLKIIGRFLSKSFGHPKRTVTED